MDIEDKKIYLDKWFSYMQSQICSGFEDLEKKMKSSKKFISANWSKKKKLREEELIKYSKMEKFLIKLESTSLLYQEHFLKNLERIF